MAVDLRLREAHLALGGVELGLGGGDGPLLHVDLRVEVAYQRKSLLGLLLSVGKTLLNLGQPGLGVLLALPGLLQRLAGRVSGVAVERQGGRRGGGAEQDKGQCRIEKQPMHAQILTKRRTPM